jgi:hypothetical protein
MAQLWEPLTLTAVTLAMPGTSAGEDGYVKPPQHLTVPDTTRAVVPFSR